MNGNRTGYALAGLMVWMLWAGELVAEDGWWSSQWKYRRQITVKGSPERQLPGDDVVAVEFLTGEKTLQDGSDIRVTTPHGRVLPSRVLRMGPADKASVAFQAVENMKQYYVYYGNPRASQKRPQLDIRRGVLQETWLHSQYPPRNVNKAERILDSPGQFLGREFRQWIFQGYNPFGPQIHTASRFTGWLICRKSGQYYFGLASNDASFLLINDKLVVSNAGRQRPHWNLKNRGTVKLEAGLHKLTVLHINRYENPVIAVAWQPPGQRRPSIIPKGVFAPVLLGMPGPMREYGRRWDVDYSARHEGESFLKEHYLQRYRFSAQIAGINDAAKVSYQWDFGDGQTSSKVSPEHVYLSDGEYKVTIKATLGTQTRVRSHRLSVTRDWHKVAHGKMESLRDYADVVSKYDYSGLSSDALAAAFVLLQRTKRPQAMVEVGREVLTRSEIPEKAADAVLPACVDALLENQQYEQAVELLRRGGEKCTNPATAASLMVRAGNLTLQLLQNADAAERLYRRVIDEYGVKTTSDAIRDARIGLGDVWRFRGDAEKATEAYRAAGPGKEIGRSSIHLIRGDYARHVEEYLRTRKYEWAREYLDRWQRNLPEDKLVGYSTLLEVQLLQASGQYAAAIGEAQALLKANPLSNYAPKLMMEIAKAFRRLGKVEQANNALGKLIKLYPESPLAEQARKTLGD